MGRIEDDLSSIFANLQEAALTMQQGGGIGHDFSTLRPRGAAVKSVGADASGPVSFMDVWDAMCGTIRSAGSRRGAMMGTLRCDHPDIEEFIDAKGAAGRLRNFNLSVLVSDAFLAAVEADQPWPLTFGGETVRTVVARNLWERIMRATYAYAEPGVIFIDRINQLNTLNYCEQIEATNPCGEQPLPAYGACLLGSINLARLIKAPFEPAAALDEARLAALVRDAVRFLDDVIDASHYPLPAQRREAQAKRRIGLGVTGLADALIACGVCYGSPAATALAGRWMARIERTAYLASAELAGEKGSFPLYDRERVLAAPAIRRLDGDVREAIGRHGLRNGLLTSIAPTGTISLFGGNVSSGVEPVFELIYRRRVLEPDGTRREETVEDYAHALFRRLKGPDAPLPPAFVTASALPPSAHLAMQAALQAHVDSSISKTINCPADISFEAFKGIYFEAYRRGLKGCTTFRPNDVTGAVLAAAPAVAAPGIAAAAMLSAQLADGAVKGGQGLARPLRSESGEARAPALAGADVVYMARPLERDGVLPGHTYKLKWADSDHALYITINDLIRDGRRRPFEIFINSRNLEHYAWIVALTRMISAVFRRGGDVAFVAEELKAIFDPRGGQWMDGRYVPSLIAAIGEIIERHMIATGFLQAEQGVGLIAQAHAEHGKDAGEGSAGPQWQASHHSQSRPGAGRSCPRCGHLGLIRQEGCWTCPQCGYSKCG